MAYEILDPLDNCANPQIFPRRSCIEHMIPAERAIYNATYEIELLGADERLTNAVINSKRRVVLLPIM